MVHFKQDMRSVFHPYELTSIANTHFGLQEENNRILRIKAIAIFVFISIFAASSATLVAAAFTASLPLATLGLVGVISSFVALRKNRDYDSMTGDWLSYVDMICNHRSNEMFQRPTIRYKSVYDSSHMKSIDDCFEKSVAEGFAYRDPRESSAISGWIVPGVYGKLLLMTTLSARKESNDYDTKFKNNCSMIRSCFEKQRGGIGDSQNELLDTMAKPNSDLSSVLLPEKISPGHGLVLDVILWFRKGNEREDFQFDDQGRMTSGDVAGHQKVACWQESLKKAKTDLEKNRSWTSFEDKLIAPMLAAKTSKELVTAIFDISESDLLTLMNRFVTYKNVKNGSEKVNNFFLMKPYTD